jgi:uncharacterized membrane protein YjgN (DUF898 family)
MQQCLHATAVPVNETPEPISPPLLDSARPPELHPFLFHGETREYFRIWIVNTLLTLLTLGLYAAWAKVRKRRYLRGNTELMGHRFDYRADPRRILVGNVIVALMFLTYMVVGEVYPQVRLGALAVGLVLLPWVIIRSISFNAHNTVYRGMRFYFRQTYGWTALVYLGQWFFIVLTLGVYYPAWVRNRKQLVIDSHRLGDAFFRFESKSGPFYVSYLVGGSMVVAAAMCGGIFTYLVTLSNHGKIPSTAQMIPFFAIYGFALFCSKHYIYASLFNHIWNRTRLNEHRFVASLQVGGWLKLQVVNLAAIIGSCGLLYPWAAVRSARYALSNLQFAPQGPIEKISRLGRNDGSAMGETAAEFVGLDIGL